MITDNITKINQRIEAACKLYGRNIDDVHLLAVSKTKPVHMIQEALASRVYNFGENYLQEALVKIEELKNEPIIWHFIGKIQSNKTKIIAQNFAWVHSVDRLKSARRLSEQRPDNLPPLNICLEVNINDEKNKSGLNVDEVVSTAKEIIKLPNIKLRGLMTIPEIANDFTTQRQAFAILRQLRDNLNAQGFELDALSMGMSNDLEAAIAEGATWVRIGTGIFGARDYGTSSD